MTKEEIVRQFLLAIGENPERDGLKDTPTRVVRSWSELYAGYRDDPKKILSKRFRATSSKMVCLNGIEYTSMCEHHTMPFHGTVDIAYLPKDYVVGISKFARLVECFARRLQIQENMTNQIASAIHTYVDTKGVAVRVQGQHTCMCARGVRSRGTTMITFSETGLFEEDPLLMQRWQHSLPPPS
jgi:GTP cyclohydrolase I